MRYTGPLASATRPQSSYPIETLILAAGRGRRLGDHAVDLPKILLPFGGRTLLARHLDRLAAAGAAAIHIVVGFQAERIEAELKRLERPDVTLITNPHWREGSVVSLDAGRAVMESGNPVVLMDADVLYDQHLIDLLMASRLPATLLLDREIEPGDEPVKICVAADGRIVDFDKQPDAAYDWHGESVGFFRFSAEIAAALALRARATIDAGGRMTEYEQPIRDLIREDAIRAASGRPALFGFEDVSGLPWTEIDFVEDVMKAEALLPMIEGPHA